MSEYFIINKIIKGLITDVCMCNRLRKEWVMSQMGVRVKKTKKKEMGLK